MTPATKWTACYVGTKMIPISQKYWFAVGAKNDTKTKWHTCYVGTKNDTRKVLKMHLILSINDVGVKSRTPQGTKNRTLLSRPQMMWVLKMTPIS